MPVTIDFSTLDLMDALDLAILIEIEALERYRQFASQLGHTHIGDPASVFAMMVKSEAKHADELSLRRKALFGDAPMRVKKTALYDVEAPNAGAVRWNMSTLHAFQIALAAEHKAYDFYNQALPYVSNEEVRTLFVELRDEETEHIELVERGIAKLPAHAAMELEDQDA